MSVEFINWYWIYSANIWGMYVIWRVSVRPSGAGLGNMSGQECTICRPGARFAGAQFAAPKISGAQFAAPKIFRGPICRTQNFLGPNLPPWGPICRGPICRGPICRHGAQSAGARFAKKWQIGPQKVRGPICRQIGAGPNLPGPNMPGPNLPRTYANMGGHISGN